MHILFVIADSKREWNCSEWRCAIPMRCINASDGNKATAIRYEDFGRFEDPQVQDAVMPADLVIYQRNLFEEPYFSAVEYFQGLGKPVILDLDDAYTLLPWSNPAHAFWIQNGRNMSPVPLEGLRNGVQLVNAVSSPSKLICQDWRADNPNTVWVPNFPQGEWYADLPSKPEAFKDRIIIGWGGSISHYDGFWFSGVRPALQSVCERHPEVIVKFCGNDGRIYFSFPIPVGQKMWQTGVPPSDWPKIISTFDIGLAPIDTLHPYESRKSWLKAAEYMLAKVPWIGTDCPCYADLREWGRVTENTPEAWEAALEHMISNLAEEREKAAAEPYEMGVSITMENNVNFYETLVGKMKGLHAAAHGLPGLIHVNMEPERPVTPLEGVIHVGPERAN